MGQNPSRIRSRKVDSWPKSILATHPDFACPPGIAKNGQRRVAFDGSPLGPAANTCQCISEHASDYERRRLRCPWLGVRSRRGRNEEDWHVASCEEKRRAWRKLYDNGCWTVERGGHSCGKWRRWCGVSYGAIPLTQEWHSQSLARTTESPQSSVRSGIFLVRACLRRDWDISSFWAFLKAHPCHCFRRAATRTS